MLSACEKGGLMEPSRKRQPEIVPGTPSDEGPPPIFSSWGRLYGAVILYLAAFIMVLYFFTTYFQILQ